MQNECSNDSDRLVQTDRGWVEVGVPEHCPNGHELQGNIDPKLRALRVLGEGTGHRTWSCRTCKETIYDPPCLDESKSAGHWKR